MNPGKYDKIFNDRFPPGLKDDVSGAILKDFIYQPDILSANLQHYGTASYYGFGMHVSVYNIHISKYDSLPPSLKMKLLLYLLTDFR